MIYFDNAATSFPKPPCVYRSVRECIKCYCGNPGRSSHALSQRSADEIYKAREAIAALLNIDNPEYVIFTQNATHALNLAIKTAIPEGAHVIISDIEHNSVIRPLFALSKARGIEYSVFSSDGDVGAQIKFLIRKNTKAVICNLLSNVNGKEIDMRAVSDVCRENELLFIADASQKIGHKAIDLKVTPCDILCAPGHKSLFGMQGVGFCVMCDGKVRKSYIEGGSGSESMNPEMPEYLPERYEAGTLPTPSIVALRSGIEFINKVGLSAIEKHIEKLTDSLKERLLDFTDISFISGENGVISFNIKDMPSSKAATLLDGYGICTRGGFHCSPSAHRLLGTDKTGTVRVSFSYLNKLWEIDSFCRALKEIIANKSS